MNGSVQLFVHQLLRRHQQDCSDAERRVRLAKTMRDVKFAAQVTANAMLRSHPEVRKSLQQLQMHASNRMEQLLEEQLARLGDQPHSEATKAMRGNLLMNDWVFLRGSYAATYVRAERESHRILHQKWTTAHVATDHGGGLPPDELGDQAKEPPPGSSGN